MRKFTALARATHSLVVPLSEEGPLPRGFDALAMRRAFERWQRIHRGAPSVSKIAEKLGVGGPRRVVLLRQRLDDPRHRRALKELLGNDLHNVLFFAVRRFLPSLKGCVRTYPFRIRDFRPEKLRTTLTAASSGGSQQAQRVGQVILALGMFRPQDAVDLVRAAEQAIPELGDYFSPPDEDDDAFSDADADESDDDGSEGEEEDEEQDNDVDGGVISSGRINAPEESGAPVEAVDSDANLPMLWSEVPELTGLHEILQQYARHKDDLRGPTEQDDVTQVIAIAGRMKDLKRAAEDAHTALAQRLAMVLPPLPQPLPSVEDNGIVVFLTRLRDTIVDARRAEEAELLKDVESLRRELDSLGLPSGELDAVKTHSAFARAREQLAPLIRRERAFHDFRDSRRRDVLHALPDQVRSELYRRAVEPGGVERGIESVAAWFVEDEAAALVAPESAIPMLLESVRTRLINGAAVPRGVWTLLARLSQAQGPTRPPWTTLLLADAALVGAIVDGEPSAVAEDELAFQLAHVGGLGGRLGAWRQRIATRALPPAERVSRLLSLSREHLDDRRLLCDLLVALAAVGRGAEVVMLACALAASERLEIVPAEVRDTMISTTLDALLRKGVEASAVVKRVFVDEPEWLAADETELTVKMSLAVVAGETAIANLIRMEHPDLMGRAREARPALVRDWLEPTLQGIDPIAADDRTVATSERARVVIEELDAARARQTVFSSWAEAAKYKAAVDEVVDAALRAIDASEPLPAFEIDALMRKGPVRGLKPIDGSRVQDALVSYAHDQERRLTMLEEVRRATGLPVRVAAARQSSLRERLAAEAEARPTLSSPFPRTFARIYALARGDNRGH